MKAVIMNDVKNVRPIPRRRTTSATDPIEEDQDRAEKVRRENLQLIIYIFVAVMIAIAWCLGTWGFSFLWIFLLISLTFGVWYGKVMSLTEQFIKYKELMVHRKRALRHSETSEWLNFIINRWWVFSSNSVSDLIKKNLDPVLNDVKPAFLENIELESFTLGENTPFIRYVQVYECAEGNSGGRKPVSWSTVVQPPAGLPRLQQYQIVLEADVGLQCDEFKMIFRTRFGGKWMGMNLDLAIEKLNISGKLQLILHLDMDTPFPHIAMVTISFQEKPEVWFAVRVLKAVQMMEIPFLKSWIHHLVMDGLTQALVDPGKVDIHVESMGPTNIPAKARSKSNAQGVLTVTILGEQTKASEEQSDAEGELPDSVATFVEDTKYCQVRVGDHKQSTPVTHGNAPWQDTCSFLVDDIKQDRLTLKCKSKVLLTTYTLALFDLNLSDFPFEHRPCVQTSVEEKIPKRQGGGTVKLDLTLEYTLLPGIEKELERGAREASGLPTEVSGIMYVCVHSATNLLGLDRNGFSDPYCIIYNNGKKVKTTHYVSRTKNPKWEVSTEFIVADFTKSMLSFIVYDWDGRNAREDDFLGSTHIILSRDEPVVIQKSLTLGYNLLNIGQVDNNKLGCISVTVTFRPVASVAKSEYQTSSANTALDPQGMKSKGFINSALLAHAGLQWGKKQKLTNLRDRKSSDSTGVGNLLSMGHGILELGIIQARDLVAMDSNGFSDPYCEVRINNERKFTTSIKKKTLNPVWDEWVTTQLPKLGEILEIVMWDRDVFFQKDFLGCLTFTVDDLKRLSVDRHHDGWFPLQRMQSGFLKLRFKVISEDFSGEEDQKMDFSPSMTLGSESSDSGAPPSQSHSPQTPSQLTSPLANQSTVESQLTPELANGNTEHNHRESSVGDNIGRQGVPQMPTPNRSEVSPELATNRWVKNPSLAPSSELLGQVTLAERFIAILTCSPNRHQASSAYTTPSPSRQRAASIAPGNSTSKRRHPFSLKLKRSASEVNLGRAPSIAPDKASQTFRKTDSFGAFDNVAVERYFGVEGQVVKLRGLQFQSSPVYCKVRIDNRTLDQRARKGSSSGRVIARSSSQPPNYDVLYNLDFDVDRSHGVYKDALLTLDIKSSAKNHICTKSFGLESLFGEEKTVDHWLSLDGGIEAQLTLTYMYLGSSRQSVRHGSFSLFKSNSKNLKKIKEQ